MDKWKIGIEDKRIRDEFVSNSAMFIDEKTILLKPCPQRAITGGLVLIIKGEELPRIADIVAGQEEYKIPDDLDISKIIALEMRSL